MHLYFRDPGGFMAEYMNTPNDLTPAASTALDPALTAAKITNLPRGIVPRTCTRLVAFVDVGAHLLWYMVVAWDERFGGSIISYGAFPEQARPYFAGSDPRPGLADLSEFRGKAQSAAIYGALSAIAGLVLGAAYRQEDTGSEMRVERCLVDANWGPGTDLVYEFCRRSPYAQVLLPSHGKFIGASSNSMATWQVRPGERAGLGWRISPASSARGRHVTFDTNHFRTFAADRVRTPAGAAGCLQLFDAGLIGHRLIADHFASEYPVGVTGRGRIVPEWKNLPGRDNHWWDCLTGAGMVGRYGREWRHTASFGAATEDQAQRALRPT